MISVQNRLRQLSGNNTKLMTKKYLIFILIYLMSSYSLFSQNSEFEVHQINGKNYYIHVVEPGNTLYFISKKFNTPIDILEKENPSVSDGLSLGEKIFIPVKKDESIGTQPVNGNYLIHKVEKGRTLYSLAKEFNIQQNDIIALNPEIDEFGIKEGQEVKIPIKQLKQQQPDIKENNPQINYLNHQVKQGETLYSLSKLYNVSVDSIKIVNNGLKEGLKVDQTIFIPIIKSESSHILNLNPKGLNSIAVDTTKIKSQQSNPGVKPIYKVALLLPFYIEENRELPVSVLEKKKIYPRSTFAVEFYQGVLTALDSISTEKNKFELFVYDSKGLDSLETEKILSKSELKQMDLIIGPLYPVNFEKAAKFAGKHNIPIVSPVKQTNKILLGNDNIFKVVSSKTSSIQHIAKLVVDSFSRDNIIAVQYQTNAESVLADVFIKEYNSILLKKTDTSRYSSVKKLVVSKNEDIVAQIRTDMNNVIFIPTNNTVFLTNLFTGLISKLKLKEYSNTRITLIGLEEWYNLENIDLEYFNTLNVHLPISQFVDYEKESTKAMIKKYYEKTETYPSFISFLGFDIASYFGTNLIQSGKVFQGEKINSNQISTQFNFFKTGIESGYENTYVRIVEYSDNQIKIIE